MKNDRRRIVLGLVLLSGAIGWLWYSYRHPWSRWRVPAPVFKTPQKPVPAAHPGKPAPRLAIVIDDVAYTTEPMDRFASLGIPLTFALLPRHKMAQPLAEKATSLHFPVMLHLPMEPLDVVHNDPGPAGLYLKMSDAELKKQFDKAYESVPHIVGINNHMGSAFTENEAKMTLLLGWIKDRHVYFLDSRTSTHSVGCRVAKRLGLACLENETFLDNEDSVEGIKKQLSIAMKLAENRGQSIAIGHYRRKFITEAFQEMLPEIKAHGVEFVTLPSLYTHEHPGH